MSRSPAKCHRSIHDRPCGATLDQHAGEALACPRASEPRHTYRPHVTSLGRVGQSFNDDEIELLSQLLAGVTVQRDMRLLTRSKVFVALAGKVLRMRDKVRAATSAAQPQQTAQEDPNATETATRTA
jgi:hypothetical protein